MAISKTVVAGFIVAALGVGPAAADEIIFSNLTAGGGFDTARAAWFGFEGGAEGDPAYNFSRAMSFVPSVTGRVSSIDMALEFPWSFSSGTLAVNLFESAGGLPGEVLETFRWVDPLGPGLSRFDSVVTPLLLAGRTYFLEARTIGEADGLWFLSLEPRDQLHLDVYRVDDGPWKTGQRDFAAAFRVSGDLDGAPVPEPATLILFGAGLALTRLRGRRRLGAVTPRLSD